MKTFDREGNDYHLNAGKNGESLSEKIAASNWHPEWKEDFGIQEKHAHLPRGIDPKAWESPASPSSR